MIWYEWNAIKGYIERAQHEDVGSKMLIISYISLIAFMCMLSMECTISVSGAIELSKVLFALIVVVALTIYGSKNLEL